MVETVGGRSVPVRAAPRRPGDPAELVADSRRAAEVLAWGPSHSSLRTIVETAWRWHSERREVVLRLANGIGTVVG